MSSYNINGVILSPAVSGAVITPSQYNNKVLALQQILDLASQLNNNIRQCTSQFSAMQDAINSLTTVTTGQYITADLADALINAINAVYEYEECLVSYYNSQGIYPNIPPIMTFSPVNKGAIITAYSWNNWNQAIYNEFEGVRLLPFLQYGSESIGFVSPSPSISAMVSPSPDTASFVSPSPSITKTTEVTAYVFAGYATNPGYVDKISPSSMDLVKTFTAPSGQKFVYGLNALSNYLFAGFATSPGEVDKISPSNMSLVKTFTASSGHTRVRNLTAFSGYVYAGYATSPGYIDKIDASTMSYVATFSAPIGYNIISALTSLSGYVFASIGNKSVVYKISPANMSAVGELNPQSSTLRFPSLAGLSGYLYVGTNTSPGEVAKVEISTMSPVKGFRAGSGKNVVRALNAFSGYVYAGYATSPGYIDKIDASTMSYVATFTAPSSQRIVSALTNLSGYLFAGFSTSIGYVDKIDVSNMSLVKTFTAPKGHGYVLSMTALG